MEWTAQQSEALALIAKWLADPHAPQIFRLYGYAGTGKTTIAKELRRMVGNVKYATFTGKAASVLQQKGCSGAQTIHSLIYRPVEGARGDQPRFVLCSESELFDADLVVLDECSMVDSALATDLETFGVPMLVLGDPFQLPPVSGAGALTSAPPDYMLTDIRRQALDNPIIWMSMQLRSGQSIKPGRYGESRIARLDEIGADEISGADMRLVGRNATRRQWNASVRKLRGFTEALPLRKEQLVCLRNNKDNGLLNGTIWNAEAASVRPSGKVQLDLTTADDGLYPTRVKTVAHAEPFIGAEITGDYKVRKLYDEFDFGYALTVHKAQGSQWSNVVVRNEAGVFGEDAARWMYTAITRASDRVTVAL